MSKPNNKIEWPTKFERIYEDEDCISIWKYDYSKTTCGPVSVEHKWKSHVKWVNPDKKKTLKDLVAEERKSKKKGS